MRSGNFRVSNVLIDVSLAASSEGPGCFVCVSSPVAGRMLTSAPVSTRNCRLETGSLKKRRLLLWPIAKAISILSCLSNQVHGCLHCQAASPTAVVIAQSVRLWSFWLVLLPTEWSTLNRECCKGLRIPARPEGIGTFCKLAMVFDFRVDQLNANIFGHPL